MPSLSFVDVKSHLIVRVFIVDVELLIIERFAVIRHGSSRPSWSD